MKSLRRLSCIALGLFIAIGLNLLSAFIFTMPVHSKLSLSGIEIQDNSVVQASYTSYPQDIDIAQNNLATTRFQSLAEADQLYLDGEVTAAEDIYRQVKPPFPDEGGENVLFNTIYDPEDLPPAGKVYWRNGQQGLEQGLNSLIFESLPRLVENYPEFIPGHLALAEAYQNAEQSQEALEVLERATSIYPDEPDLLRAKVKALADEEQYLEASITARQFTLIYPDYFEAPEFAHLSEEYHDRFRRKLRQELLGQQIGGAFLGAIRGVLTNDWSSGITGLQTLFLLGQGESEVGSKFAEEYQAQLVLLDDPEVAEYITGIGNRFAPLMGRDDFEYEYYVVQDNTLNAFALPGGNFFVNTGAILGTRSEAELAGIMGHEIAHAALSHGYQRMANASFMNSLQGLIPFGDLIANLVANEYSREHEKQSDILGTRVLAANGYAADGLRNFMVTLREQTGDRGTSLTASHPAPANRVSYLEGLIKRNGYNRYAFEGVEKHKEIQDRIRGIVPTEEVVETQQEEPDRLSSNPQQLEVLTPQDENLITRASEGFIASLTRDSVTVRLEDFDLRGITLSARILIENQSDRPFGFVPIFAKVVDIDEEQLTSNITFETSEDVLVQPGEILEGQLSIFDQDRQNSFSEELILVITEGTSGGRLFRVPF